MNEETDDQWMFETWAKCKAISPKRAKECFAVVLQAKIYGEIQKERLDSIADPVLKESVLKMLREN